MGEVSRTDFEAMLVRHYSAQTVAVEPQEVDGIVRAMLAEDGRMGKVRNRNMGFAAFVAAQVRFVPAWTWAAQVAIVAVMCVVACAGGNADAAKITVGILSAMSVLVGIPTVHASKLHGVVELEYSCPNNAASVMVARLIVLGCSSALVVALTVAATVAFLDLGAFAVALWACPPFFLSCAGSLMALRKAAPATAPMLCVALTTACSAALLVLASMVPDLYAHASLASWASAAVIALAWLVREVVMTLRTVTAGLDVFSPQLAQTYN